MSKMSVLDLLQCIFWALAGGLPIMLAGMAGAWDQEMRSKHQEGTSFFIVILIVLLQAAVMLCAYKAGVKL